MRSNDLTSRWKPLGETSPQYLEDARLQLHWAAQLAASFGQTLADPKEDDSHRSMVWWPSWEMLVSSASVSPDGFRLGLLPRDLEIVLLNRNREILARLPLSGHTLDEVYVWVGKALAKATGWWRGAVRLQRPEYLMPDHGIAGGGRFLAGDPLQFGELARWYGNAHAVLVELGESIGPASEVRCWPHHFDIGLLLTLPSTEAGGVRSIGVGLSPGDTYYGEPYFYVSPHPAPAAPNTPPLDGGGAWHHEDWFGAVLTGTDLLENAEQAGQQVTVAQAFLADAIDACRRMLFDGEESA